MQNTQVNQQPLRRKVPVTNRHVAQILKYILNLNLKTTWKQFIWHQVLHQALHLDKQYCIMKNNHCNKAQI